MALHGHSGGARAPQLGGTLVQKTFLVGHQYFSGYRLPTMCGNENFIITDICNNILI